MFKYFIVLFLFLSLGCSKIEHATKTADQINSSTQELKHETKRGLRKQKELGAKVSMDKALDSLAEAPDVKQRLLNASVYFEVMPFQFVVADEKKREQYYSKALSLFFTEAFPRFSVIRKPRTEKIKTRIQQDYNVIEPATFSRSKVTTFRELGALATQMHRISKDQIEVTDKPISFYKLCEQLIKTEKSVAKCADCEYENLPLHLKENIQFASDAVEFFQFAHNVLVYGALGQVFNKVSTKDYFLYKVGQKKITFNGLIKETTNSGDLKLAQGRLDRAKEIRQLFSKLGIPIHYSNLSYEKKLTTLLSFPKGKSRSKNIVNKDQKKRLEKFVASLKEAQAEYQKVSQQQNSGDNQ